MPLQICKLPPVQQQRSSLICFSVLNKLAYHGSVALIAVAGNYVVQQHQFKHLSTRIGRIEDCFQKIQNDIADIKAMLRELQARQEATEQILTLALAHCLFRDCCKGNKW